MDSKDGAKESIQVHFVDLGESFPMVIPMHIYLRNLASMAGATLSSASFFVAVLSEFQKEERIFQNTSSSLYVTVGQWIR